MTQKVRTALVVDDSRLARIALSKLLQKREVEVEMVGTGGEALDYLSNSRPDVVFMDYMMPDMDGFEATRQIRNIPGETDIPVVMYTSQDSDEDREKARSLGIAGFLSKPSGEDSLDEILELLAQQIRSKPRAEPAARQASLSGGAPEPVPAAANTPTAEPEPRVPGPPRQITIPWEEIRHVARQAAEALAGEHAERIARDRVEPLRRELAEAVEESAATARRLAEQSARSAADTASREVAERIADRTARMIAQNVAEDVAARVARDVGPEAAKRIIEDIQGEIASHVQQMLAGDEFRGQVRAMVMDELAPELRSSIGEQAAGVAREAAEEAAEALIRERLAIYRSELMRTMEETVAQRTAGLAGRLTRMTALLSLLVVGGVAVSLYAALYGLPF